MGTIWEVLKIIWIIITHLPELWALIKKIIDMINELKTQQERAQAWKELNEAAKTARKTGDTSELQKAFKKWFPRHRKAS